MSAPLKIGFIFLSMLLVITVLPGCMEYSPEQDASLNETEQAVAIALGDPEVSHNIPLGTGDYEIVDVSPSYFEQVGPGVNFSGTLQTVTFRCCNSSSLYRVFVDVENGTVVSGVWSWVKAPMPCTPSEPPREFSTLEEAAEYLAPRCVLEVPSTVPSGYGFSGALVYGEPCPRQHVVYINRDDRLLLVQVSSGDPSYAFAISMPASADVYVNGSPGTYVEGIGAAQVSWSTGNRSYWLSGPLGKDGLLEVASSVRPFTIPSIETPVYRTADGSYIPGISHFGSPAVFWPDVVAVTAGTENTGEIVLESRAKGYGMVHYRILSRVDQPVSHARTLPMPAGMEITIAPEDFMAYPDQTYRSTITVKTEAATPPGTYVIGYREVFEGVGTGEGWFSVDVAG